MLFDCGRACTSRLAAHDPRLIWRVDKLFLTHLHSDHIVGIPDLWLSGWLHGRREPLRVWGPAGTAGLMQGLRDAYAADIRYRADNGDRRNASGLKTRTERVSDDVSEVFRFGDVAVTSFPVSHARIPAVGYRVDYAGRSLLISGDTTATPNLTRYGSESDVVLLEVLSPAMLAYLNGRFPEAQVDAVLRLHLTVEQAGAVFADIGPELGVYYHTVAGCQADKELLMQTREVYPGPVQVAHDLLQIHIFPTYVDTRYASDRVSGCSTDVDG